jgi:enamine deaminase RidA (YjgF/YER057c/UK114 family)
MVIAWTLLVNQNDLICLLNIVNKKVQIMSDHKHYTPTSIKAPLGNYVHGVEVNPNARYIYTSGQLGFSKDGAIPNCVEQQAIICFENIQAILAEGGMNFSDVVRISAYVTQREYFAIYMKVRDRYVSAPAPASTLMMVSGFTREEFKVEVEVIAAKDV